MGISRSSALVSFIALLALLLAAGCGQAPPPTDPNIFKPVVVKVTGSEGMVFNGSYGDNSEKFSVSSASTPVEYSFESPRGAVFVDFVKETEAGSMTVLVTQGDRKLAQETTTAPFGLIHISVPIK